tara:strand:- start:3875 stop:6118 length:2244 start_codon:yes stop_codon:yes gene_type:complete
MRIWIIAGTVLVALLAAIGLYVAGVFLGWHGHSRGPGTITGDAIPAAVVSERAQAQLAAADAAGGPTETQILFGDLHVHSTFSTDAFVWALPMLRGEGANPIADACDFARYCSALDFWAMTDHAEALTPARWAQSVDTVRQCAARSQPGGVPDVIPFMGFEWTQVGGLPEDHYGHKNVIFETLDDADIAARPIAAAGTTVRVLRENAGSMLPPEIAFLDLPNRQSYYDFTRFVSEVRDTPLCDAETPSGELPDGCYEIADTPGDLVARLESQDLDPIIIPHGSTWGLYTPPGTTWDKQLVPDMRPEEMTLVEIYSGHGNSEEYRSWRPNLGPIDDLTCPEPTEDYLPSCWRAGDIIEDRCLADGMDAATCAERARIARQNSVDVGLAGHLTVEGEMVADWLDAGQCRDCFLPAMNYNPGTSVQAAMALSNFDSGTPLRYRWGFVGSSDTHTARPGIGYKPFGRHYMTDTGGADTQALAERFVAPDDAAPAQSIALDRDALLANAGFQMTEVERQASFFTGGGLAAVHTSGRSREAIWDAMERREVYATSGLRQLLWFDMINEAGDVIAPMGGEADSGDVPRFRVRAVGSPVQNPGCPDVSIHGLDPDRLEQLCRGECYNPTDARYRITRIEVVRIRPQILEDEDINLLIEDVWQTFDCDGADGCTATFEDPGFADEARDTIYYVRAIQEPTGQVNGDNLRCEYDETGTCVAVNPCFGDYRTEMSDECVADVEHRAWSSPIYVGYRPL